MLSAGLLKFSFLFLMVLETMIYILECLDFVMNNEKNKTSTLFSSNFILNYFNTSKNVTHIHLHHNLIYPNFWMLFLSLKYYKYKKI